MIVIDQGKQERHVFRVLCLHLLELLECLFFLACIEVKVTNHHLITLVVGVFIGKGLHLLEGSFFVVHLHEKTKLLHRKLLTLPFLHLNLVEHLHHFGIVILLFVEKSYFSSF